jgi:hypothetical protein
MKTPIKNISEDQNTITHESGFQTVFKIPKGKAICRNCCYGVLPFCDTPCCSESRIDKKNGIFVQKK